MVDEPGLLVDGTEPSSLRTADELVVELGVEGGAEVVCPDNGTGSRSGIVAGGTLSPAPSSAEAGSSASGNGFTD
jgi:hypothetical protein